MLAIDAMVSDGPQLQSIDTVAGRLAYVAQTSGRSTATYAIPVHTTILRELIPEVQLSSSKEKVSPSFKSFALYEESSPGRKADSKGKKQLGKFYFERPRPDKDEWKVLSQSFKNNKLYAAAKAEEEQ